MSLGRRGQIREDREEVPVQPGLHRHELEPEERRDRERAQRTGEDRQRGALRLSIWNNLGGGRFIEQMIGEGRESHLGARVFDLDGDGYLDVVSIAWDVPDAIHVWRNDAARE